MDLSLSNIINVSVSEAGAGVGEYNTSNIALFTHEAPADSFGTDGYAIYKSPTEVATDFGTSSKVYQMANAIFSQRPNILANGGYLVVILVHAQKQHITFSGVPASGQMILSFGGAPAAAVLYGDSAAQIQTKLRAVSGLEKVVVTGSMATSLTVEMLGQYGSVALLHVDSDSLQTAGSVAVTATVAESLAGETVDLAVTRTADLVQYFGVMMAKIVPQTDMLSLAAVMEPLNKIAFVVSKTAADVEVSGMLDLLRSGSFHKTRGLFYGSTDETSALVMMASYAGRGLSTVFSGSKTTSSIHLKDLIGVQPDPSMTQTLLMKCLAAGVDTYVSLQGVPKVFSSGDNKFFDQVYNLEWLIGAIKVAGFNCLAQLSTKLPQTEDGITLLKSQYRQVCEQAVRNQYFAPGTWTLPETFGVQEDFYANIEQRGYYIYSTPISEQSSADRAARVAPLVQIAGKEAGAVHSSSVLININK